MKSPLWMGPNRLPSTNSTGVSAAKGPVARLYNRANRSPLEIMPNPEKNPGARELFAALGTFAAGFLAVAWAIHAAIADPLRLHADIRSEKLVIMDEMRGRAESAAFGSSHIHNGFNPGAFDRALAGSPLQTRSENLGIAGGSQSEQRAMALAFVRQLKPPAHNSRACFVMLELNAGANFTSDHLVHPRAIDIYDWPTARFVSHLVEPQMTFKQRAGRTGYALAAMALHYTNVGMLSNLIFAPPVDQTQLAGETVDDRRGQIIGLYDPVREAAMAREIAAEPKQMQLAPATIEPGNIQLIDEIAAASAVKGVSFVYIAMPKLSDLALSYLYPDAVDASGIEVPIVNLARPDLYPQLYKAGLWQDDAHLNDLGAKMASALVADRLKQWYAAHGGAPRCGG